MVFERVCIQGQAPKLGNSSTRAAGNIQFAQEQEQHISPHCRHQCDAPITAGGAASACSVRNQPASAAYTAGLADSVLYTGEDKVT